MMYKIGLTGGICTGKTFVLNILEELGCYTIRADDIAREIIFSPDSPVLQQIKEKFGEDIYDEKRGIKKEQFNQLLFDDSEKRNFINKIVHPLVAAEREKKFKDIQQTEIYPFFIYESALLVEAGSYKDFDKIIVVYASQEEQMKRLINRDRIGTEEAEKKIKSQFPLSEKLKVAHYTIDTTGTFENAKAKTLESYYLMKKDFNIE